MSKTLTTYDKQSMLLYSMIVAGKSANFTDRALKAFIAQLHQARGSKINVEPFTLIAEMSAVALDKAVRAAKLGNYTKLTRGFREVVNAKLDLDTCTPADLEKCHGIGPKTSRFFIMWIRPTEVYAALDVHVLRWLRELGHAAPKSTPQNMKRYRELEKIFLKEAKARGMTPRALDSQIWEAGAGRTQETALP